MYGLNINPTYPGGTPSLEELQNLGVELVRYTYYDSSGGDQLDPTRAQHYKQKAQEYHQAGITSLIILTYDTYPNKPSPDGSDHDWNNYIDRFVRRSEQIARLLAQWKPAFQVWNEPDHHTRADYSPTLREAVFGRMLRRTYQAIKAVLPEAMVVTAGLATGDPGWLTRVINSLNGELPADRIAFHPYGQRPDPNWPHARWFFNEGSYVGNLLNSYYQAGQKKPVWITEMGIKHEDLGHDQNKMAEFLRRYYKAMNNRFQDKVEQLIWFCYSDNMVEPFGLLDRNQQPKPIYQAFREAAAERPRPTEPEPVAPPPPPAGLPTTPPSSQPPTDVTTPQPTLAELTALLNQANTIQSQIPQFQAQLTKLEQQLQQIMNQQSQLLQQLQHWSDQPATPTTPSTPATPAGPTPPPIENITTQLPRHSTLPYYPDRPLDQIKRIIVHHTAIAPSIGAERIAAYRVNTQGWPGIGYHYYITGEGKIQQTNKLTTESWHAGNFNAMSIGVAFAGDFTTAVPSQAQLDAGAKLIVYLLKRFNLPLQAVAGYKELAQTASPGQQWDNGQRWGDKLRQQIQANM